MTPLSPTELARLAGVSRDTLRHYERRGLLSPQRTSSGYRRYPPDSVERVRLIRRALMVGFSLKELARVLGEREKGRVPCQSVRALVQARLAELTKKLQELRLLKRDLEALLRGWDATLAVTPKGVQARLLDGLAKEDAFGVNRTNQPSPALRPLTISRRIR